MNLIDRFRVGREIATESGTDEEMDPALMEALVDFRASVHAWAGDALSRPRAIVAVPGSRVWRQAAGWALGCVFLASGAWVAFDSHGTKQVAGTAAVHAANTQSRVGSVLARVATVTPKHARRVASDEEELLAMVDSDVSRAVPSAMEPLAQLMAEDESK